MATINDLEFAITWLSCYDEAEDDQENIKAKANAIAFLEKEINKRIKRKAK